MRPVVSDVSYDHITSLIVQGSRPPPGTWLRENGFSAVVFCAIEFQPSELYYPGVRVVRAHLDDSGRPMTNREWQEARDASREAARLVRLGAKVYVSCFMGHNRSGLVTGLTLHRLSGASGKRVVDHVKSRRQDALSNPWFRAALDALQAVPKQHRRSFSPYSVIVPDSQ